MDRCTAAARVLGRAAVVGVLLAGCGGADTSDVAAPQVTPEGGGTDVQGSDGSTGGDASTEEQRQRAREELSASARPAPPTRLEPGPDPSAGSRPGGGTRQEQVAAAVELASRTAGVAPDDVSVVRAAAVTWPNGGLGCPEPGMAYAEALVDGWWVVVDAGGEELDLRAGGGGGFRVCPAGAGTDPVGGAGEL